MKIFEVFYTVGKVKGIATCDNWDEVETFLRILYKLGTTITEIKIIKIQ